MGFLKTFLLDSGTSGEESGRIHLGVEGRNFALSGTFYHRPYLPMDPGLLVLLMVFFDKQMMIQMELKNWVRTYGYKTYY